MAHGMPLVYTVKSFILKRQLAHISQTNIEIKDIRVRVLRGTINLLLRNVDADDLVTCVHEQRKRRIGSSRRAVQDTGGIASQLRSPEIPQELIDRRIIAPHG